MNVKITIVKKDKINYEESYYFHEVYNIRVNSKKQVVFSFLHNMEKDHEEAFDMEDIMKIKILDVGHIVLMEDFLKKIEANEARAYSLLVSHSMPDLPPDFWKDILDDDNKDVDPL